MLDLAYLMELFNALSKNLHTNSAGNFGMPFSYTWKVSDRCKAKDLKELSRESIEEDSSFTMSCIN